MRTIGLDPIEMLVVPPSTEKYAVALPEVVKLGVAAAL